MLVVWAGDNMTSLALLDTELKVVSRSAIEMPREAFLLAGDRALLIGEKQAWTWQPDGHSPPAWKSPVELGGGLVAGSGQVLLFGTGPLVLGTGPPVDTIAQPCGLIAPFYARWAESLWRAPVATRGAGTPADHACRQALGGPADDGLGATLVAEIGRPDRGARDERFTLALATLAAIGTPWARTPLRTALETGRGAANIRATRLPRSPKPVAIPR